MAQGKTIKRTIELNYIALGVDKIKSTLDAIDISRYDKKTQAAFKKLGTFAKNFGEDLKKATADGPLSPESAAILEKSYGGFIKNTEKLMTSMLGSVDSEFSEGVEYINEQIRKSRTEIQKLQVDKKNLLVKRDTGGKIIPQSKKADKELDRGIVDQLREEGVIKEKLLSYNNREIKDVNVLRETREKLLEDAEKLGEEERQKLATLGISTAEQAEALEILKRVVEVGETKLTAEQSLQQLNNLKAIQAKKEITLNKEVLKLEKLETLEKTKQARLDSDEITQQDLLNDLKEGGTGAEVQKEENKVKSDTAKLLGTLVAVEKEHNRVKEEATKKEKSNTKAKKKNTEEVKKQENAIVKATKQVFSYGLAFTVLRRIYRETIRTITELDEALTEMAIVTSMNRAETWELVGTMQDLAKETGFTTTEIAKLSTVYFRQGRALSDVIELTRVAAKAARVAGISAQDSADYLTSAINGFGLAAEQALAVSDKFAALAATSASSYEELAKGLSKFAAQANVAGISIDFALGMLAKGVETTREAPETIGTALKTVLARLRELTDYGKTLEDGMDVNRVEKALGQMNVQLMDSNGQFRDMEQVLTELGMKWDTLNTNQQASIAVALAGTRQQSRLIAIMQDFDRTMSLVEKSEESAGATTAQHVEYMQSMEAAMVGLQNAWQKFITAITNSDMVIAVVKSITLGIETLTAAFEIFGPVGQAGVVILVSSIIAMKGLTMVGNLATAMLNRQVVALTASVAAHELSGNVKLKDAAASQLLTTQQLIETGSVWGLVTASLASSRAKTAKTWATWKETLATKTNIVLTNLDTTSKGVNVVATNTLTAATWRLTVALLSNPYVLVAAALIAVGVGLIALATKSDFAQKRIEKFSEEMRAANYDIGQSTKKVAELIEKIEELNDLAFITDTQREEVKDLGEELADLVGEKYVTRVDGVVDWDLSEAGVKAWEENQLKDEKKNIDKLFKKTVGKGPLREMWTEFWDPLAAIWGRETGMGTKLDTTTERNNLTDYLLSEFEEFYDDLSTEDEKLYRQFMEDRLQNDPNMIDWTNASDVSDFITGDMKDSIEMLKAINEEVSADNTLENQIDSIQNIWEGSTDEGKKFLEEHYADLFFLQDEFSKKGLRILEELGITSTQELQKGIEHYGKNFEAMVRLRTKRIEELTATGMSSAEATSEAWAELARATSDADQKNWLYTQSFIETTQELGQSLDNLASKMENVREKQEAWLAGELPYDDLYQFIIAHPDLFDNMETINRFISGEDITSEYFIETVEKERIAMVSLRDASIRLETAMRTGNEAATKAAMADYIHYKAILTKTGALSDLTKSQNDYNTALAITEVYETLGIENLELENRLIETQKQNVSDIAQQVRSDLQSIKKDFNQNMIDAGLEGSFDKYFDIINGVIIPIYDELANLTPATMREINRVLEEYQNGLNEAYDVFGELRDANLKAEEESLDKQKTIYEDYFDKLDELEKQRESKKSREDIVSQLQRLEGATDERSRQKALELRKELNTLDEKSAKDATKASREALIDSFDDRYAELENKWALAGQQFIIAMAEGGTVAGNNAMAALIAGGWIPASTSLGMETTTVIGSEFDTISTISERPTNESSRNRDPDSPGYAKGGLVDFTGIAKLHGSRSKPEMVLDANQTQMFMNLRDILGKISLGNGSSESINIEQITIKTDKLNNDQDFNKAGEVLAKAFSAAIKSRGITTNARK